jgi:hypothetical protein
MYAAQMFKIEAVKELCEVKSGKKLKEITWF